MDTKGVNDMESRIIEAAKQVFVRKGYEAATMSDVATEAGIGRTALHYYYRTKEILFDAIFGQLMAALLPNINRIMELDKPMLEKIPLVIEQYIELIKKNPLFPVFVINELNRDPLHLFRVVMKEPERIRPIQKLRAQIEREMELGVIRKMPVEDLVTTIVSLVVFPMLIRQPLSAAFWGGDLNQFEEFMNRRHDLIVGIVTQMLKI